MKLSMDKKLSTKFELKFFSIIIYNLKFYLQTIKLSKDKNLSFQKSFLSMFHSEDKNFSAFTYVSTSFPPLPSKLY